MPLPPHQYIERKTAAVKTERLFSDQVVHLLYSRIREVSPFLFKQLVSKQACNLLGFLNYDLPNWPLPRSGNDAAWDKIFKDKIGRAHV